MSTEAAATANGTSNLRKIVLIVAVVTLVGLLGGVGGVVFDRDAGPRKAPEVSTPTDPAQGVPGSTASAGLGRMSAAALPQSSGEYITVRDVPVFLPTDWTVSWSDEDQATLSSPQSTVIGVFVTSVPPTTDASAWVAQNLADSVGSSSNYSQLGVWDVKTVAPFGSVVSFAFQDFVATYTDQSGSWPVYGRSIVYVRQDGTLLKLMVVTSGGVDQFDKELESWAEIVQSTERTFAGV